MGESEQLLDNSWRRKKPDTVVSLGDTAQKLIESRVSPQQAVFRPVAQLWNQLLPDELRRHCRISDISDGQMEVLVDTPSHAYELRLCSTELIEQLKEYCPRARIRKIKFVVG